MKIYDVLAPDDRGYKPGDAFPGLLPMWISGQAMFEVIPGTGGARDLTRFSTSETGRWVGAAPVVDGVGVPVCMDIEGVQWVEGVTRKSRPIRTDVRLATGDQVKEDAALLCAALRAARNVTRLTLAGKVPSPIGIYGLLPSGFNFFNAVLLNDDAELRRMMAANDTLAACGLLDEEFGATALFPQLYTASADRMAWSRFATCVRRECQRLDPPHFNLPHIAFLKPTLPGDSVLMDLEFWELQLRTVRNLGFAGAVVWQAGPRSPAWELVKPYAEAAQRIASEARSDTMTAGSGVPIGRQR